MPGRGLVVLEVPVPTLGLVTNMPVHKAPQGSLTDGSNVFVDTDGVLKTRLGYQAVEVIGPTAGRVIGLVNYQDLSGSFITVAQTLTKWSALLGGVWTNVTGVDAASASADSNGRFAAFFEGTRISVYGVNDTNTLKRWDSGLAAYVTLAEATTGFGSAKDIAVVANRLMVINTVEGGVRKPVRVRWSSINDGTTWPAGAVADLPDDNDRFVGAQLVGRTSLLILRDHSAYLAFAVQGSDAQAFAFERVPSSARISGPVSPASIVLAEGSVYYLGQDFRIWKYDGSLQPISGRINPTIKAAINAGFEDRAHSAYFPPKRQLWFFFPSTLTSSSSDPNAAVVYNLEEDRFEPLQTFTEGITASSPILEFQSIDWAHIGGSGASPDQTDWASLPWQSWADIPSSTQTGVYIGTSAGQVHRFFSGTTDNGVVISYSVTYPLYNVDPLKNLRVHYLELFLKQAVNPELLTATLTAFLDPYDTKPTTIVNIGVEQMDHSTFRILVMPGPNNPNNVTANYLQLVLSSAGNLAQFQLGGGYLAVYEDWRGDYGRDLGGL